MRTADVPGNALCEYYSPKNREKARGAYLMSKTRADYEFEILSLRDAIRDDPTNAEEYQHKLDYRISKWIDHSEIIIFGANNEQTPWTDEMIGYPVVPMPTKQSCGFDQVGDYQFAIDGPYDFANCFGPLVVERKSCQDLYGTLFGDRERFYREITRFEADPRFTQMIVTVECNFTDWVSYNPPGGKGVSIGHKLAALASLQARGIPVHFAGSPQLAAVFYRYCVRQSIHKNWERWIL